MFLDNFFSVAKLVAILYIMVGVGFLADKIGKFTQKAAKLATGLLFYIVTPCVIVNSFISNFNKGAGIKLKELLPALLFLACTYLIGIPLSELFFRREKASKRSIYRYASVYGNCGYLGLPMVQAVVGDKGVFYSAIAIAIFNMMAFTQGVIQMHEGDEGKAKINIKKVLVNPGTLGIMLGIPVLVLSLGFGVDLTGKAWEIVVKPINYIGSMNTPLAMICLGTFLANTDIKKTFTDRNNYMVGLIRLVLVPLLLFGIMYAFNKIVAIPAVLAVSLIVSACPPSANNTVLFAANFGKDTGLASTTVACTTILSIITMPVILALVQLAFPLR